MMVAISAMHGRHALSRVWAQHVASLGFDAVCVAVTGGDMENATICNDAGFLWQWTPNAPLAFKFNTAMGQAMNLRHHDASATKFMILPSDDMPSPAWVEAARNTEHDYIVPHTCAIYDLQSGQAFKMRKVQWNPGSTLKFGAGRVVSRKAVEACGGELWPAEANRGLDSASHARLHAHGIKHHVIETEGIPLTDIKTSRINEHGQEVSENLWPWGTWLGSGEMIGENDALHMLSPELKTELLSLRR